MQIPVLPAQTAVEPGNVFKKPLGRSDARTAVRELGWGPRARLGPDVQGEAGPPGSAGRTVVGAGRFPTTLTCHWVPLQTVAAANEQSEWHGSQQACVPPALFKWREAWQRGLQTEGLRESRYPPRTNRQESWVPGLSPSLFLICKTLPRSEVPAASLSLIPDPGSDELS